MSRGTRRRGARRGIARIGLSGWNYPAWKDGFYAGVRRKDWLAFAASRFATLEVNATFYREQRASTLERWRAETPDGFVFALKGHRYVTHTLRLAGAAESIDRQRDNAAPLGPRLGAVLWQLPPGLTADPARLGKFLAALGRWPAVPHALEFRHESWFTDETAEMLEHAGVANCISDAARFKRWDAVTGSLVYLRLHGRPETYYSAYGEAGLRPWAEKIAGWRDAGRDVLVYFDNDAAGAAPDDAVRLTEMVDSG